MKRKPYPTDLTDAQWEHLEPLLPAEKAGGRPREIPLREILDAYWYLLRAGCSWRMLPHDFPPWSTVYSQVRRWKHEGVWQALHERLREDSRLADGRPTEPSAAVLDSQTVKAGDNAGPRGYDAGKKTTGRKRHILVDTLGLLMAVVLTVASVQDRDGAKAVLPTRAGCGLGCAWCSPTAATPGSWWGG